MQVGFGKLVNYVHDIYVNVVFYLSSPAVQAPSKPPGYIYTTGNGWFYVFPLLVIHIKKQYFCQGFLVDEFW